MNRALLFCAVLTLWTPLTRADDDTPHNIYHSLKRFFTGSDGHHASSAPRRHRRAKRASARTSKQGSPEARPSTTPELAVLPETSPASNGGSVAVPAPSASMSRSAPADRLESSPAGSPAASRVMVLPAASPLSPDGTPEPSPALSTTGQGRP